jgi:hypothetical protein
MTALARFGWNVTATRRGPSARPVGTPNGACFVPKGIFRRTAAGPVMATIPC